MLLVVPGRPDPAVRLERAEAGEVAVELGREEARTAHLAVGHDIDARLLLVAQRGVDGIVLKLGDVGRTELVPAGRSHADDHPRRVCVRPDDARGEVAAEPRPGRLRHAGSENAKARAGLLTKIARCASALMPRRCIASANSPRRNVQPGVPP